MIEIIEMLLDFGLVILIWMVQLIVYPSFTYYQPNNLMIWHRKYTGFITVIVAPLMFGQLGVTGYLMFTDFSILLLMKSILIALVWGLTFSYFAPTHGKISQGSFTKKKLAQLVKFNWSRTILWTVVFFLALYQTYIFGL